MTTTITNSPSSVPAGTPWTDPTFAYADNSSYARTSTDTAYQQYGNYGFTDPGGVTTITVVRIRYDAWTAGNEKITIAYSTDGGTNWTSNSATSLTTLEATYWYVITSGRTWTWTLLNNTNFRVRATAARTGAMTEVRLDWIPVEVTYDTTIQSTQTIMIG
jgi:mannose-6-phosphate isomerase-like protein (cupin superfamily)